MKFDNTIAFATGLFFIVTMSLSAASANEPEVTELSAAPTVEVNGVVLKIQGEKVDVHEQMENLIGKVSSVEERRSAVQKAIAEIEKVIETLEVKSDKTGADEQEIERLISVNEFMLSILLSEKQNLMEESALKASIDKSLCPNGMTLLGRSLDGSMTCMHSTPGKLLSSSPSGLETLFVSSLAVVSPSGRTTVTMTCPDNYVAASEGHYLPTSLVVLEQSRPDALDSKNWILRFANWDTYTRYASGYLNCMKIAP